MNKKLLYEASNDNLREFKRKRLTFLEFLNYYRHDSQRVSVEFK